MADYPPQDLDQPDYKALRDYAMTYPEAHEDFPWGHAAIKVRKKVFVFLSCAEGKLSLTAKLPQSADAAVTLAGAKPTGYGLGRYGWVSVSYALDADAVPHAMLREWIEESYRAVAPKTLGRKVPAGGPTAG